MPFELERWQGRWEHNVRYDLSESGVAAMSIGEVLTLADADPAELLTRPMGYSMTRGSEPLRTAIAAYYPGAGPDNILVTVGSAEANFIVAWTCVGDRTRVTIQMPAYMQLHGLCLNLGGEVTTFVQRPELGWAPDLNDVVEAIRPDTRLVVVTNPNNPTGHVLSADARRAIVERVEAVGAWLLVDEVYRGAELADPVTETFWGASERVVVSSGLSKAFGLPGLRIGWLVAPEAFLTQVVQRHDYAVIGPCNASDWVATRALGARSLLRARTHRILEGNYPVVESWMAERGPAFRWKAPDAGAICLFEYPFALDSRALADEIRTGYDVLLAVGHHFGMGRYVRLGFGIEPSVLRQGLDVLGPALDAMT